MRSAFAVTVVAGFGFAAAGLVQAIRSSERFGLAAVEVSGAERVARATVERLAGLKPGTNLFALDLAAADARVEQHPYIARARARRVLPRGVSIEVVEHEPRLLVSLGLTYVATGQGQLLEPVGPGSPLDLPLVTGLSRSDVAGGRVDALAEVTALLDRWERMKLPPVSEINVHPVLGSTVRVVDGWSVSLGSPAELRLSQLPRIVRDFGDQSIEEIRLDGRRQGDRATVAVRGGGR